MPKEPIGVKTIAYSMIRWRRKSVSFPHLKDKSHPFND